jgi:hypothetical protein
VLIREHIGILLNYGIEIAHFGKQGSIWQLMKARDCFSVLTVTLQVFLRLNFTVPAGSNLPESRIW